MTYFDFPCSPTYRRGEAWIKLQQGIGDKDDLAYLEMTNPLEATREPQPTIIITGIKQQDFQSLQGELKHFEKKLQEHIDANIKARKPKTKGPIDI